MNAGEICLSVTELNGYIRSLMEQDEVLGSVTLRGEISNMKRHSTGHLYFSLKDDGAAIAAVMFRGAAQGLSFLPKDGMKVKVFGRVSVYEKSGQYQIYVQTMLDDGMGDLYRAYEALRLKLTEEGLFDLEKKKKLPAMPRRIGIITSPTGAAVRDMLQVSGRRNPLVDILIFPALVQGNEAPPSLCAGLAYFNAERNVDLIIIGRGGGSIEDLWAFNDERVVRAVAASEIPVISAVGHETDITLCDFAADRRAPTPSAAAELAVRDMGDAKAYLLRTEERLFGAVRTAQNHKSAKLAYLQKHIQLASPMSRLEQNTLHVMHLQERVESATQRKYEKGKQALGALSARLCALNPLSVLGRGYSMTENENGGVIGSVTKLQAGQKIRLRMRDGRAYATVEDVEREDDYGKRNDL